MSRTFLNTQVLSNVHQVRKCFVQGEGPQAKDWQVSPASCRRMTYAALSSKRVKWSIGEKTKGLSRVRIVRYRRKFRAAERKGAELMADDG